MGHAHSNHADHRPSSIHHSPASILFTTSDGSVGLSHDFVKHYIRYMPFEIKQPVLTRRDVRLIEANWTLIVSGLSTSYDELRHGNPDKFFHRTYYSLLFAVMPSCRTIFRSSMHLQGKTLFSILRAMTSILHSHDLVDRMQALAARHLNYGCERGDYTTVGVTLLKTLEIVSGDQWNYDVKEAYLTAYCLILYLMMPVIVQNPPANITESLVATITAVRFGHANHMSPHHTYDHPELLSEPRHPTSTARRLTLTHSFPLRFFPGDGVILGIPIVTDHDQTDTNHSKQVTIAKQYFPIASYRANASNTLDIYVDETTSAHYPWFSHPDASTVGCSSLRLFWVESDHHFEVDDVPKLPTQVVFVSYGVGVAPFISMLQALHSVRKTYHGHVVMIHCAATLEQAEANLSLATSLLEIRQWPQCSIHCGTPEAMLPLVSMVPNPIAQHMYVCGPSAFVDSATDTFTKVGGLDGNVHVSFYDNYDSNGKPPQHPCNGRDGPAGVWNLRRGSSAADAHAHRAP